MDYVGYFEESEEWMRSIGKGISKIHFRERRGTGHAVCDRKTEKCEVHQDSYNPHDEFFSHIWHDSPEFILQTLSFIGFTVFLGVAMSSVSKKGKS